MNTWNEYEKLVLEKLDCHTMKLDDTNRNIANLKEKVYEDIADLKEKVNDDIADLKESTTSAISAIKVSEGRKEGASSVWKKVGAYIAGVTTTGCFILLQWMLM